VWTSVKDTAVVGRACRFGREAIRFGNLMEPLEARSSSRSNFVGLGGSGGLISWEFSITSSPCGLSTSFEVVVESSMGLASPPIIAADLEFF
jgi:hypothetical protein